MLDYIEGVEQRVGSPARQQEARLPERFGEEARRLQDEAFEAARQDAEDEAYLAREARERDFERAELMFEEPSPERDAELQRLQDEFERDRRELLAQRGLRGHHAARASHLSGRPAGSYERSRGWGEGAHERQGDQQHERAHERQGDQQHERAGFPGHASEHAADPPGRQAGLWGDEPSAGQVAMAERLAALRELQGNDPREDRDDPRDR